MKDNWGEIFKNIDLELEVKVAIRGSGRIVKPAYPRRIKDWLQI